MKKMFSLFVGIVRLTSSASKFSCSSEMSATADTPLQDFASASLLLGPASLHCASVVLATASFFRDFTDCSEWTVVFFFFPFHPQLPSTFAGGGRNLFPKPCKVLSISHYGPCFLLNAGIPQKGGHCVTLLFGFGLIKLYPEKG